MRVRITEIHPSSCHFQYRHVVVGQVVEVAGSIRNAVVTGDAGWYAFSTSTLIENGGRSRYGISPCRFEEVPDGPVGEVQAIHADGTATIQIQGGVHPDVLEVARTTARLPQPGDRVRILAIHPGSSHYANRDQAIGQIVTLSGFFVNNLQTGWYGIISTTGLPWATDQRAIYGCQVEIVHEQRPAIPNSEENQMPSELKDGILVMEGQSYRASFRPLDQRQIDEALKKVANSGYQKIKGAFLIDGNPVTVCTNQTQTIAGVDLKRLNILAKCQMIGGNMVPVFTGSDAIEVNCTWTPPDDCIPRLAVIAKHDSSIRWKISTVLLFCRTGSCSPGGYFRLPLPNLFADGRVCMGDRFQYFPPENTLEGCLKHAIRHLAESPWGTDMMPDVSKIRSLFRFNPSTLTSLAPEAAWHTFCYRCSRVEMDEMFS